MTSRLFSRVIPLIAVLALGACSQDNTGDAARPGTSSLPEGTFLLFPNPQVQADGSLQTDSVAYANAYYAAIDPTNTKDTLAKWKAVNGFDGGSGTQVEVVFGDVRDLGYGRRMVMRQNNNGDIAVYVENYMVSTVVDYTFNGLNVEAAVERATRWLDSINAIEYSIGPGGIERFVQFFQFNPVTGAREVMVNLDGRGDKFMPGPCLTCHGGRADPLTPSGEFARVANSHSQQRGDATGRMNPLEVDTFAFSTKPGFTRAEQELTLKEMNKIILCTYPRALAAAGSEDNCRRDRTTGSDEWWGTFSSINPFPLLDVAAARLIKAAYGGNGLPSNVYMDTFIPDEWNSTAAERALYLGVVAPICRNCHSARGTANESDIDFTSFAKFQGYADRIMAHVFDRGNMPLAKILFEDFWSTSKAETLATFLEGEGFVVRDGAGALLRPGRPIADPGPGRSIKQGPTLLSAASSRFSTTYAWSVVSGPNGAVPPASFTLTGANSVQPTFNASANGAYVLQLVTGNATAQSAPAQLTLLVNNALPLAPSEIRFADIKAVLQGVGPDCQGCHVPPVAPGSNPPIVYQSIDRNGDTFVNATDELWFYTEVRGRINFTDVAASPLLRKPSGHHHNGGLRPGFNTAAPIGDTDRASYEMFVNWITNGAPFQ